jgi:dTDP-4-dehydrorhamnose 3,5-epimerase
MSTRERWTILQTWRSDKLDLLVLKPSAVFEDHRGLYIETWNRDLYEAAGVGIGWRQDDVAISRRGVLRGIHGDYRTWKLVTCLLGAFYIVVVDNRTDSATYKTWESFVLSDHNHRQVLVPPGFGHAYLVMSDTAIFHYKPSTYYQGMDKQFTLKWNDPELGIYWPIAQPILSERDR